MILIFFFNGLMNYLLMMTTIVLRFIVALLCDMRLNKYNHKMLNELFRNEFVMFIIILHKDNNKSLLIKSDKEKERNNLCWKMVLYFTY